MINITTVCHTIDNNRKDAPLCKQMDNVNGLAPPSLFRNLMVTIWIFKLYSWQRVDKDKMNCA